MTTFAIRLRGPGGEPVDLWRTIVSHGLAWLPPTSVDEEARTLTAVLAVPRGKPRSVAVSQGRAGHARVEVAGAALSARAREALETALRRVLSLDRDLSGFYASVRDDPDLAWAAAGAGRMLRSATVFEEVVKTVCTTNCAWSATVRMVERIVEHLGEPAAGVVADGARGRAFPTPDAMAEAPESFYRDVVRAGYRGAYLRAFARSVADGETDVEPLATVSRDEMSDDEVFKRLVELPGVGPYAAAHVMMMIGRHSRPILDSWSRPKYATMLGRKTVSDKAIERRFRRYGDHAGLAFWLYVTRDWVD